MVDDLVGPAGATHFEVAPEAYDRLMGRYLPTLGQALLEVVGVTPGMQVLDVGCGTGGITTVLAEQVGASRVTALDPSLPFVDACRFRNPGVDVRVGTAERLPFLDDSFDLTVATLVVGFLTDPAAGVAEMCRVTRPGGRVALVFWSHDEMPLLTTFWRAAAELGAGVAGDAERVGRRTGELATLLQTAGASRVTQHRLPASASYCGMDDWWTSFTGGAGPVGAYLLQQPARARDALLARCAELLRRDGDLFTQHATAWCAVGTVEEPGPLSCR